MFSRSHFLPFRICPSLSCHCIDNLNDLSEDESIDFDGGPSSDEWRGSIRNPHPTLLKEWGEHCLDLRGPSIKFVTLFFEFLIYDLLHPSTLSDSRSSSPQFRRNLWKNVKIFSNYFYIGSAMFLVTLIMV